MEHHKDTNQAPIIAVTFGKKREMLAAGFAKPKIKPITIHQMINCYESPPGTL